MIIDDDAAIRDVYDIVFTRAGYSVKVFANEKHILYNEFSEPDIFLIDKQLHGANGIDLCRYLKSRKTNSETPVVIFSATARSEKEAMNAGASAFVEKPFSNAHLLKIVKDTLKDT